eukprot:TRINITY_DN2916_c0_g1_i1.p1 TRINITY_DN2916_c0_g1~~TRINITY_DN2916_c0_g1_i1.p1  ORF type:complete len:478 (-),score=49.53 TRINITY_DN2916_c0_g1_i1:439-1872(-)
MVTAREALTHSVMCHQLVSFLAFSVVIPSSYSLSQALGQLARWSGLLIGIGKSMVLLGGGAVWLWLRFDPEGWRNARSIYVGCVAMQTCALIAYAWIVMQLPDHGLVESTDSQFLSSALLVCRAIHGIFDGPLMLLHSNLLAIVTPNSEKTAVFTRLRYMGLLGLGWGPMMSSMCGNAFHTRRWSIAAPMVLTAAFSCLVGIYIILAFPSKVFSASEAESQSSNVEASMEDETASEQASLMNQIRTTSSNLDSAPLSLSWNHLMMLGLSISSQCVRDFNASSTFSGTSMIFETEFHWSPRTVGLAVGACFLMAIPYVALHRVSKKHLSEESWMRFFAAITILFSTPLYPGFGSDFSLPEAMAVFLSNAFVAPALTLYGGAVDGISISSLSAYPEWRNDFLFARQTSIDLIGRGFGPPFARHVLQLEGRHTYAIDQIMLSLLLLVLTEAMLFVNDAHRRQQKDVGETVCYGSTCTSDV